MTLEPREEEATYALIDDDDSESDCESVDQDDESMGSALRTALNDAKLLKRRLGMRRLHSMKHMGSAEEVDIPVIAWFRHPREEQPAAQLPESLAYHHHEAPELDDQFPMVTTSTPGRQRGEKGPTRRSSGIWHHHKQERRRSSIIMMDESSRREFAALTA